MFDNSKTAQLDNLRFKAVNFVSRFGNPIPQVPKSPQMAIPIIWGGIKPTTNLTARPIHKQQSCILTERAWLTQPIPLIAMKPLQLSRWHLPQPPSDMETDDLAKDSMPPLVLCIDTSGSTESRLPNGESIFEIESYAAIAVEQLFQRFQKLGISVPELISVNFSNVTRVFESSLSQDQRAMNLLGYQGGGTTLNIQALADIKHNFCMVIVTDGEISDANQTAKALIADQRINYIITLQISANQKLT
ncbi:MAG: VWA domain-containing protein, partial [Desulfamplus sp.]|nr:VWA domain-containing protein [Desulfamplus sp.]